MPNEPKADWEKEAQPATETTEAKGERPDCVSCGRPIVAIELDATRCPACTDPPRPAPQPVEGVSDEGPTTAGERLLARGYAMGQEDASRSSAAKDARIAELEATVEKWGPVVEAACALAEKAQPVTRSGRQKPSTDDLADVDLDPLCEAVDALEAEEPTP